MTIFYISDSLRQKIAEMLEIRDWSKRFIWSRHIKHNVTSTQNNLLRQKYHDHMKIEYYHTKQTDKQLTINEVVIFSTAVAEFAAFKYSDVVG